MTHNQIDFWKMRNDKLDREHQRRIDEAKLQETVRYNQVQEQLKKIDQDLQRDLMAINQRYQTKQLEIAEQELHWKQKYQTSQLANEQRRLELTAQSNAINAMSAQEVIRANKVQESFKERSISIDELLAPLTAAGKRAEVNKTNATIQNVRAQTKTEFNRPLEVQSRTFQNIVSPFINLAGSVLRAVY